MAAGPATLLTSSGGLSGQFQKYFDRKFLTTVLQELVMDQFGQKRPLPPHAGAKTVTFTRPPAPDVAQVQTIATEGSYSGITDRPFSWTFIDAVLTTQVGRPTTISDILEETALFDTLKAVVTLFGQDAAHYVDLDITKKLCAATSGGDTHITERFSGGVSNFTNLDLANAPDAVLTIQDLAGAMTALEVARAPKAMAPDLKGKSSTPAKTFEYVGVVCPQVFYNISRDPDFRESGYRGVNEGLFSNEKGTWHGIRLILGTQPFIESGASDGGGHAGQYTYDTTGSIFTTLCLGSEAFGVVSLASQSPFSPKIIVVSTPDSSNPLLLFKTVGWKAWFITKRLKSDWAVAIRSKTTFS